MIKVCHLTSVHPRYDVRIFHKECKSLYKHNYDVSLIVADGKGDEIKDGIKIFDVGLKTNHRLKRFFLAVNKVLEKALSIDAKIYHLHDPELLRIAPRLQKDGHCVIYDAHEDLPRQILSKEYIQPFFRRLVSNITENIEDHISAKLDGIIAATPTIAERFKKKNSKTINVNNYPALDENVPEINWDNKQNTICYIGGINKTRGCMELVKSLQDTDTKLNLAGNYESNEFRNQLIRCGGWEKVVEYGFVDRKKIKQILESSKIGIVTLHPTLSYLNSLPVKMFEYMVAGLPVVCSEFPLWQKIVADNKCGLCVNPLNPKEIACAINYLLTNNDQSFDMGQRGRQLVIDKYNWNCESEKLLAFYSNLF